MKLARIFTGVKGLGLALALGTGLVGCAVLTVDVDVYKGSLVNEEHVQLHQLAALATAAKPMLVGLRNTLEWPYVKGMPPKGSQQCSGHDVYWYEHGYVADPFGPMPDPPSDRTLNGVRHHVGPTETVSVVPPPQDSGCWKGFQKPLARRVNSVLHLYEDLGAKELSYYAKQLLDAQGRAQAAQFILEGDEKRDAERFARILSGLKPSLDTNQGKLMEAYTTLLCFKSDEEIGAPVCANLSRKSSFRKAGALMNALTAIGDKKGSGQDGKDGTGRKTVEQVLIDNWERADTYQAYKSTDIYQGRLPFRAVWKLLAEAGQDSTLAKATKDLFKTDAQGMEAHKVLTAWVRELTEAYWDAREASHDLWEASLRVVIQLDRLEQAESSQHRAVLDQAIDVAVRLTGLRHIASAVHRVNSDELCALLSKALISGMTCDSTGAKPQAMWTELAVQANPDRYEVLLRRALSKAPADTAYFLLDLDRLEQGAAPISSTSKVRTLVQDINAVSTQHIVRLGLNRSSTDGDAHDDYQRLIQDLSRGLAGGFERGRLFYGIHTLTEKYLEVHDRATDTRNSRNIQSIDEDEHERRLLDALVEFAEKVRFLANHESLASPPVASGFILGGVEKLTRGLLGDRIIDNSIGPLITEGLDESKKQRYVRVLQAVGNSILFSANELRERERHREQGEKKRDAEVMAARSVYSPDPEKVITDLLAELEHEKQAAQTALDAVKVRKKKIEGDIGSSTAPKTGLHAEQDKAASEVLKSDAKLKDYRNSLDTLKAIHAVLTGDVIREVISQWGTNPPGAADEGDFLIGGTLSLEGTLRKVRKGNSDWDDVLRHLASSDTKQDFIAYRKLVNKASLKRVDLFDNFVAQIKWLIAERVPRNEWQAKLDGITQRIDTLQKEVADLEKQINNTLPQDKADFETAKTRIASVKAAVLKEIDQDRPFAPSKEVYALISNHLQRTNSTDDQTAQRILASRMPPPDLPPLDPKDYKSPIEVMDTVIALLRHRQMEAVERFGKGSAQEEKATETLENAYRHRAGMIYIRPSSAYLRTSFPSTSLQDDPNLAWDNMLLKQGLRNLPFSSELRDILNPSVKQDQVLTSELDKQYWQNINRVRVSGAGSTNQALVKDDVGNWYVKQYFGDTERIWESAKNLALFSMSTKVPVDLAKQLNKAPSPEEFAGNGKESPTLQKVLERHKGAYTTHTKEIQAKLERLHDKELQETLIAAWDAHTNLKEDATFNAELKQALTAEIVVWNKVASTLKEKADQDSGQAIVKDVGALSRLGRMLLASITKISSSIYSSDITQEEKKLEERQEKLAEELDKEKKTLEEENLAAEKKKLEAKKKAEQEKKREMAAFEVHKVVGGQVMAILTDRNRVLDQYEQAIVFIGDAANPKETKKSN